MTPFDLITLALTALIGLPTLIILVVGLWTFAIDMVRGRW